MSEKGKITRGRLGSLSLKKEGERQCFLFSKHLIICTRGSGGKLHLTKVRAAGPGLAGADAGPAGGPGRRRHGRARACTGSTAGWSELAADGFSREMVGSGRVSRVGTPAGAPTRYQRREARRSSGSPEGCPCVCACGHGCGGGADRQSGPGPLPSLGRR